MAKFLVVHPVGNEMTLEAATPVAKAAKANSTVDAYWVKSWYAREQGKLYCEWDAKDAASIRQVLEKVVKDLGSEFPTEGIYKLENEFIVSSENFR